MKILKYPCTVSRYFCWGVEGEGETGVNESIRQGTTGNVGTRMLDHIVVCLLDWSVALSLQRSNHFISIWIAGYY